MKAKVVTHDNFRVIAASEAVPNNHDKNSTGEKLNTSDLEY